MDILRIIIASIVATTLLVGCDNKVENSSTKQPLMDNPPLLLPKPNIGDTKEYWIQSYSLVSNNKIDWSNKNQRVGTKALVSYQVKEINNDQININITANHMELLVRDNAAYLNPLLQAVLSNGMHYQLNVNSKDSQLISQADTKTQQQIMESLDLRTEYKYLQSTFAVPFLPASLPLVKGQQIKFTNFMQMANLTVEIEEITDKNISVSLKANSEKAHLYGKAVLQKETGWLEKMALVKEMPLEDREDYTLRSVLLIGPSSWSHNNNRQLQEEMQVKDTASYLNPFPVFNFDAEHWQKVQQQEQNSPINSGKLYNLTNLDGSSQLMLITSNNVEAIPQLLGKYQMTSLALFDKDNKPIPNSILFPTSSNVYKIKTTTGTETNLASYKLKIVESSTKIKPEDIAKIIANISFKPYQIEKISLPLTNKTQSANSQDKDFTVDISPTDQAKVYLLHWRAKDNVIFNPQLMYGADNALIQFIQPDTESWLTPAETRIINSIPYGFDNRIKIAFTTTPPQQLDLYIIRENSKAIATKRTITFSRN